MDYHYSSYFPRHWWWWRPGPFTATVGPEKKMDGGPPTPFDMFHPPLPSLIFLT